jgi:hypothetical protein
MAVHTQQILSSPPFIKLSRTLPLYYLCHLFTYEAIVLLIQEMDEEVQVNHKVQVSIRKACPGRHPIHRHRDCSQE